MLLMMSPRVVLIVWMEPKADNGSHSYLISTPAALARALAARAAAVVQTTAFRRRALQVAVQSAAKRFRRGFIPRQLNLPALAGKSLSYIDSILKSPTGDNGCGIGRMNNGYDENGRCSSVSPPRVGDPRSA